MTTMYIKASLLLMLVTSMIISLTWAIDESEELSEGERRQLNKEFSNCTIGPNTRKKYAAGGCNLDLYLELRKRCIKLKRCIHDEEHHNEIDIESCPFMDDMIMDIPQLDSLISQHCVPAGRRKKRKIRRFQDFPVAKWPRNIKFKIHSSIQGRQRQVIKQAITMWMDGTCLNFNELKENETYKKPHIQFTGVPYFGCYSYIGRVISLIPQAIYLNAIVCSSVGIIAHEIGHTLGFFHEHQRPDRDRYVHINTQNIIKGRETFFSVIRSSLIEDLGVEYDYTSDMHYNPTAFTKKEKSTDCTINPLYGPTIGQRVELSFSDLRLANLAYCNDICTNRIQNCQHGGYQDPKDCSRCRCQDGWGGPYCTLPAPHKGEVCGGIRKASHSWSVISSPNYFKESSNNVYQNGQECSWLIEAPRGSQAAIKFVDDFGVYCNAGVCNHWVEVRYTTMSKPGPRFCCLDTPTIVLRSQWEKALVIFKAKYDVDNKIHRRGFQVHYAIDDDECKSSPCRHGGVCKDGVADYTCTCVNGWHGKSCEFSETEDGDTPPTNLPPLDIALMIDSSSRMDKPWSDLKVFSKRLISNLDIGLTKTRAGIIYFDRLAYVVAELNGQRSKQKLINKVDNIVLGDPTANFFAPLWMLKNYFFTKSGGDRANVSDIGIFITDSSLNFMAKLARTGAEHVRSSGIKLFAIGVGPRVERDKLAEITGDQERVFIFQTVADMRSVAVMQNVITKLILTVYGHSRAKGASTTSSTTTTTTTATTTPQPTTTTTTIAPTTTTMEITTPTTTTTSTTLPPTTTPLVKKTTTILTTIKNKLTTSSPHRATTNIQSVKTTRSPTTTKSPSNFNNNKTYGNGGQAKVSPPSRTTTDLPRTMLTTLLPTLKPTSASVEVEEPRYCAWKLSECSKPCGGCGKLWKTRVCFYRNGDIKEIFKFTQYCNVKTCKGTEQCWYYVGKFYTDACKKCCDGYHQVGDTCELGPPNSSEKLIG